MWPPRLGPGALQGSLQSWKPPEEGERGREGCPVYMKRTPCVTLPVGGRGGEHFPPNQEYQCLTGALTNYYKRNGVRNRSLFSYLSGGHRSRNGFQGLKVQAWTRTHSF